MKFLLVFLFLPASLRLIGQGDCPPVTKLKAIYSENKEFRQLMDSALANVQALPDGSANFWKNKDVAALYIFLNQWYYEGPTAANALDGILKFSQLYYHNPYGLRFVNEEPGLSWTFFFVREHGKYMDSRESAGPVSRWLADSSLHNEEYVIPPGGYISFNSFFTRELKPGVREIARAKDNSVVVSPVDGDVNWLDIDLKADTAVPVKGRMSLTVEQLLGRSRFASRFIGGKALSVILMPTNYHHFHSPVSGRLIESRQNVGEVLFGSQLMDFFMTPQGDFSVFEKYKHGYFIFQTEAGGCVAMIPVGLETIGSVVFENGVKDISSEAGVTVQKGERLGHFAYGGSLVILLFEKGRFGNVSVQQGQQIGVFDRK